MFRTRAIGRGPRCASMYHRIISSIERSVRLDGLEPPATRQTQTCASVDAVLGVYVRQSSTCDCVEMRSSHYFGR